MDTKVDTARVKTIGIGHQVKLLENEVLTITAAKTTTGVHGGMMEMSGMPIMTRTMETTI